MSYRFLDSGEGDMRVRRTRTHLKEALLQMVAERPVAKITSSDGGGAPCCKNQRD